MSSGEKITITLILLLFIMQIGYVRMLSEMIDMSLLVLSFMVIMFVFVDVLAVKVLFIFRGNRIGDV